MVRKVSGCVLLLLIDSCQEIAENQNPGKNYNNVRKELLGFKSNLHIIFYLIVSESEIEIVRILHGRMDLKSNI